MEKKNLAGPNPTPSEALLKAEESQRQAFTNDSNKENIKVIGAASGAAAFGVAAVVCIAMHQKKTRSLRSKSSTTSSWLPIHGASTTQGSKSTIGGSSMAGAQLSLKAATNCRHFSLAEIKKATKNFDESHVIGVGGFGKLQESDGQGSKRSTPVDNNATTNIISMRYSTLSLGSEDEFSADDPTSNTAIFSQISPPTGR
ncbi:hypothetical protein Dimus_029978 [Dionaea muscipula]